MVRKNVGLTHWNYRIVSVGKGKDKYYTIREVYYEKDRPVTVTTKPCYPHGINLKELTGDFRLMKLAFNKPILKYEDF